MMGAILAGSYYILQRYHKSTTQNEYNGFSKAEVKDVKVDKDNSNARTCSAEKGAITARPHTSRATISIPGCKSEMRFHVFRRHGRCFIYAYINITNLSGKVLEFPYYKELQVNFVENGILLRQQNNEFSGDFTFVMDKILTKSGGAIVVKPKRTRTARLKKNISYKTYKYLKHYLLNLADEKMEVVLFLVMRQRVTKQSVDVKAIYLFEMKFNERVK